MEPARLGKGLAGSVNLRIYRSGTQQVQLKAEHRFLSPDICQLYLGSDHDGKISTISLPAGTGAVWSRGRPGDGQDGPRDGGRY